MAASTAAVLTQASSRLTNVLQLAAVALCLCFYYAEPGTTSDFQAALIGAAFSPVAIITLLFSVLSKYTRSRTRTSSTHAHALVDPRPRVVCVPQVLLHVYHRP